ncbi:MAG: hypothetical protein HQL37_03070 [Alphaproteobacteria bacterium]|nr:hypothetical protein [Alphaproteobacteria bacterium]
MLAPSDGLPPEAAQAEPIVDAYRRSADRKLVAEHNALRRQLRAEGRWHYDRDDPETLYLSSTDGYGHDLLKQSEDIIARIDAGFLDRLRRGDLTAWARNGSPLAPFCEIPASAWKVLPLGDIVTGTLKVPGGPELFDIRIGPKVTPAPPPPPQPVPLAGPLPPEPTTGAPGKPSSMHLVEAEFERRCAAGTLAPTLKEQARLLEDWFRRQYPETQPVTAKTIENRLRDTFRRAKGGQG